MARGLAADEGTARCDSTATGVWLDPVKAQAWVLAQLKGQGIIMRAA